MAEPPSDRPKTTCTFAALGGSTKRVATLSTRADRLVTHTRMQTTRVLQSRVGVPFPVHPREAFDQVRGAFVRGGKPLVVPLVPGCAGADGSTKGLA